MQSSQHPQTHEPLHAVAVPQPSCTHHGEDVVTLAAKASGKELDLDVPERATIHAGDPSCVLETLRPLGSEPGRTCPQMVS